MAKNHSGKLMTGMIFNIQRYSLQDGTGIRTTVFFKGCPLHCLWCSNPESHASCKQILFSQNNCVDCGMCVKSCKFGARDHGYDSSLCTHCMACVENCPTAALEQTGKQMTVDEVMKEILRDMVFFQSSKGGVTFSGGEVLSQAEFACELAKQIKKSGINLAVETTGYAGWEKAKELFIQCDEILYDIKLMDDSRHRKYTGVSNSLILENAAKLAKTAKQVIIRLPLIGGINDDEENILATACFMKENGIQEIHFLPYHRFGEKKYEKMGKSYDFSAYTPTSERMEYLKELLSGQDISVHIGGA